MRECLLEMRLSLLELDSSSALLSLACPLSQPPPAPTQRAELPSEPCLCDGSSLTSYRCLDSPSPDVSVLLSPSVPYSVRSKSKPPKLESSGRVQATSFTVSAPNWKPNYILIAPNTHFSPTPQSPQ